MIWFAILAAFVVGIVVGVVLFVVVAICLDEPDSIYRHHTSPDDRSFAA